MYEFGEELRPIMRRMAMCAEVNSDQSLRILVDRVVSVIADLHSHGAPDTHDYQGEDPPYFNMAALDRMMEDAAHGKPIGDVFRVHNKWVLFSGIGIDCDGHYWLNVEGTIDQDTRRGFADA